MAIILNFKEESGKKKDIKLFDRFHLTDSMSPSMRSMFVIECKHCRQTVDLERKSLKCPKCGHQIFKK